MDDKLAELDRFVEETAAFLGISAPSGRIDLVLIPRALRKSDTWPCNIIGNCYVDAPDRGGGVIYADPSGLEWGEFAEAQWHELVHAIDIPANGRSHWVLNEGLAHYLGMDWATDVFVDQFPELLLALVDEPEPDSGKYGVAMHFVGSLIERSGIERFTEFRRSVAYGAGFEDFAVAYQKVYGEALMDGLEAMRAKGIQGRRIDTTCDGEAVPWQDIDLQVELAGACGDGWFYGGLGVNLVEAAHDDFPAIYAKFFVVDVPTTALYNLKIRSPDLRAFGHLRSCGETTFGALGSIDGSGSTGLLQAGKHELLVGFPAGAETEFSLELTYQGPPPP